MANSSVRLAQDLSKIASIIGKALNRITPKQIEHWAKTNIAIYTVLKKLSVIS